MRSRLLQPLGERRHIRRTRAAKVAVTGAVAPTPQLRDAAVERVRSAGGPLDRAIYSCPCGCMFRAAVSTTVACPHCACEQAW